MFRFAYLTLMISVFSCSNGTSYGSSQGVGGAIANLFGESGEHLTLKDVHLDGPGLLNRSVSVSGRLQILGQFGTFVVIEEDRVRMLVDLSRIGGSMRPGQLVKGQVVEVVGKVQSGQKGHVYLIANSIRPG